MQEGKVKALLDNHIRHIADRIQDAAVGKAASDLTGVLPEGQKVRSLERVIARDSEDISTGST